MFDPIAPKTVAWKVHLVFSLGGIGPCQIPSAPPEASKNKRSKNGQKLSETSPVGATPQDTILWQATWNMPAITKAGCANLKLPELFPGSAKMFTSPYLVVWKRGKTRSHLKIIESRGRIWRMSLGNQSIKCWSSAPIGFLDCGLTWLTSTFVRKIWLEPQTEQLFQQQPIGTGVYTNISVGYPVVILRSYWKSPFHIWVNHHFIHFDRPCSSIYTIAMLHNQRANRQMPFVCGDCNCT